MSLLLEFNRKHNIELVDNEESDLSELESPVDDAVASDYSDVVKPRNKGKRKRKTKTKKRAKLDTTVKDVDDFEPKPEAIKAIKRLLDPDRLKSELEALKNTQTYQALGQGYKPPSNDELVKDFIHNHQESNYIGLAIESLKPCSIADENGSDDSVDSLTLEVDLIIYQLQGAAASLPKLLLHQFQLNIISRAIQVETCRALVAIYNWICNTGPDLVRRLFDTHRTSDSITRLQNKYPEYANAVNQTYRYVETHSALQDAPLRLPPGWVKSIDQDEGKAQLAKYAQMPASFFGILNTRAKGTVTLGKPPGRLSRNPDVVYKASQKIFLDALTKQILGDSLTKLDKVFMRKQGSHSRQEMQIENRCIVRGIFLHALAEVCGTESIFASSEISAFIASPTYILVDSPSLHNPIRFVPAFMKNREETLKTLVDCISKHWNDRVMLEATQLGNFIHHRMLEFGVKQYIDEEAYLNTESLESHCSQQAKAQQTKKPRTTVPDLPVRVILHDIWTLPTNISLGKTGILLREVLNNARQLPANFQEMRNILKDQDPGGRGFEVDNDYMNPIREKNAGTTLLRAKFSGKPLTSAIGLSNILLWMGTGQGFGTRKFINQGEMFFPDLDACVARFSNAHHANLELARQVVGTEKAGKSTGQKIHQHAAYLQIDNMRLYGTANSWLSVIQTVMGSRALGGKQTHTIQHKFEPYFSMQIQQEWTTFLGPLADEDPETVDGERPTWRSTYDFITKLRIVGFGSGLTALQTTHVLAFFHICQMLTPIEMASWIAEHPTLGAQSGLADLGFVLDTQAAVKGAFLVFYTHLEKHLSSDNKKLLCFGPIFVEHLLCKLSRWTWVLGRAHIDLTALGHAAVVKQQEWIPNGNHTDYRAFPIPLTIELDTAANVLYDAGYVHNP